MILPKITVVTPSFRSVSTISETINSVLNQRYKNFEYIVIDGAGDNTQEILKRFDDQITYWCSEPDGGQYNAITKGFERATGDIFCWLNADDKLLPDALQVVAEIFAAFPKIDWVSSLLPGSLDAKGYYSGHAKIRGFSKSAFLDGFFLPSTRRRGTFIQQESTFFRRSLWERLDAPFSGFALAGDFALWCEFYKLTELVGISYPLAAFRHIVGQRSENMEEYLIEARQALEELQQFDDSEQYTRQIGQLIGLPLVKRQFRHMLSYEGQKIVRERHRELDAGWKIKTGRFFP